MSGTYLLGEIKIPHEKGITIIKILNDEGGYFLFITEDGVKGTLLRTVPLYDCDIKDLGKIWKLR